MIRKTFILLAISSTLVAVAQETNNEKLPPLEPSYAWSVEPPLGLRIPATIDTLPDNYAQRFVPSARSAAYATTGNYGAEGQNMIWAERPQGQDFFFNNAIEPWIPSLRKMRYYNTRVPMTLLSYNTAGGRDNAQDRLNAIFSGNINSKTQIGALLDYIYSKGCYNNQADKTLSWGLNGSYIGDRYEMQAFYNQYNLLNKENGGITDPLYITDPALVQGGVTTVDPKTIPTRLTAAHTRLRGRQLWVNNRYKIGYWQHEYEGDSIVSSTYVPVTSIIYTLDYKASKHMFRDDSSNDLGNFFEHTYLTEKSTEDLTRTWSLKNTVGVSLLEGFHRYAKFGLGAYVSHEIQRYTQTPDTLQRTEGLTPWPDGVRSIAPTHRENRLRVGAQLTKQQGSLLRYDAAVEFGLTGDVAGDVMARGTVETRIPLRFDSIQVSGFGHFSNTAPAYLLKEYLSNHFIWQNDFGKTRNYRIGGAVSSRRTGTEISAMVENVQNYIYFNSISRPEQYGGNIQIFSATLTQNLRFGWFNWDNKVTYQTTSDQTRLPLPQLAVYSNLYFKFSIATLKLQLGVDCDWYTKYYAPAYQPALATFTVQDKVKLGNYPFANVYANMKLSKVRFYVMMSHINQGWFTKNYFSVVDYPLNPRRFQLGLSVDFAN